MKAEEVRVRKVPRGVPGVEIAPTSPAAVAAKEIAEKRKEDEVAKAKVRCCRKCGKPGHRSDGCPLSQGGKIEKMNRAVGGDSSVRAALEELKAERALLDKTIEFLERRLAK